jgi:hypothetical protein
MQFLQLKDLTKYSKKQRIVTAFSCNVYVAERNIFTWLRIIKLQETPLCEIVLEEPLHNYFKISIDFVFLWTRFLRIWILIYLGVGEWM